MECAAPVAGAARQLVSTLQAHDPDWLLNRSASTSTAATCWSAARPAPRTSLSCSTTFVEQLAKVPAHCCASKSLRGVEFADKPLSK
jgi:hypothetical protein